MSRVFRGKFLHQLKAAYHKGELTFHGQLKSLGDPKKFEALLNASVKTDWVVYCKRPFGGPRQVLKYLARYTHRVAIANSRLISYENGTVRFRWKDYRHGSQTNVMSLRDTEFIRRFLMHVLPAGLVRIRHHGFLANRNRNGNLKQCRALLGVKDSPPIPDAVASDGNEPLETLCPNCQSGRMRPSELQPIGGVSTRVALRRFAAGLDFQDSS